MHSTYPEDLSQRFSSCWPHTVGKCRDEWSHSWQTCASGDQESMSYVADKTGQQTELRKHQSSQYWQSFYSSLTETASL